MKHLLQSRAFINGKWVEAKSGNRFSVFNPFDGKEIANIPDMGKEDALEAISSAQAAFPSWSSLLSRERAAFILKWADLIEENAEDLALLLTTEQGKPLTESKEEVLDGAEVLRWYAEEGKRIHGYTQPSPDTSRYVMTMRQPVGVVAGITPWNFPFSIPLQKSGPALAAGCTVILKPAEDTPLSALAAMYLAEKAGFPPGILNIVTCKDPRGVGEELLSNPLVKKISFTGSTEVGKYILEKSAATVKKVTVELGGNCPFIVFEDADLEKAVQDALEFKFYNCGQCCNNVNRFFIQEGIFDAFLRKFEEGAKRIQIGPMINQEGLAKVEELLEDAKAKGAHILCGGKKEKGLFYPPTILKNMSLSMRMYKEEIFGPLAPFYSFKEEKEVISLANDTNYGLAGYFYTENIARVHRVMRSLEAGSVGVNTTNVWSYMLPFGGWKESGIGREGGIINTLDDYCETKSISMRV